MPNQSPTGSETSQGWSRWDSCWLTSLYKGSSLKRLQCSLKGQGEQDSLLFVQHFAGSSATSSLSPTMKLHPRTSAMQVKQTSCTLQPQMNTTYFWFCSHTQPNPAHRYCSLFHKHQVWVCDNQYLCSLEGRHNSSGINTHTGVQPAHQQSRCHLLALLSPVADIQELFRAGIKGFHTNCSANFLQIALKVVC